MNTGPAGLAGQIALDDGHAITAPGGMTENVRPGY
jgi:hypothetical protein